MNDSLTLLSDTPQILNIEWEDHKRIIKCPTKAPCMASYKGSIKFSDGKSDYSHRSHPKGGKLRLGVKASKSSSYKLVTYEVKYKKIYRR